MQLPAQMQAHVSHSGPQHAQLPPPRAAATVRVADILKRPGRLKRPQVYFYIFVFVCVCVFVCVFASGAKMSKLDMYAAHSELQDTLQRIFIILRGLPGAGKSRVARTLRDIEVK